MLKSPRAWGEAAMESGERRFFYPLTSLQIGDMQSYLSVLTIFFLPISKKFLILVDCRPWLADLDMRPAHLWQLMVTKSRQSPFANRKIQRQKKSFSKRVDSKNGAKSDQDKNRVPRRWVSLIRAALNRKRPFLRIGKLKDSFMSSDLHDTFYGFIIFEVSWADVRGINYLNELLTDTSMAVEAKIMKRWEFDSVKKASSSLSSWFMGTNYERSLLRNFLNDGFKTGDVFFDAHEDTCSVVDDDDDSGSSESSPLTMPSKCQLFTPVSGSFKRRKISESTFITNEVGANLYKSDSEKIAMSPIHSTNSCSDVSADNKNVSAIPAATQYKDVLILFRFDDHDLPFKLKDIIIAERRLLTLLEYGLPSWSIFLQSYPVICNFYRPWMCPLARILYILVSIATVLIGFYDLYKNVPVLKATASRLCGPLFNWIESWEMISRIKCLGTIIFLHNVEIAIDWFVVASRAAKSVFFVLTKPFVGPLMELADILEPFRLLCLETGELLTSVTCSVIGSTGSVVVSAVNLLVWPFWLVLSFTWSLATSIMYPIILILWEVLILPARLIYACLSITAAFFSSIWGTIGMVWSTVAPIFQIMPKSGVTTVSDYEIPLWRSLCLKVFHAIKGILYGFIAFFATCNRHRLSISNRMQEIVQDRSSAYRRLLDSAHALKKPTPHTPEFQIGRTHRRHNPNSSSERKPKRRSRKNKGAKED